MSSNTPNDDDATILNVSNAHKCCSKTNNDNHNYNNNNNHNHLLLNQDNQNQNDVVIKSYR